MGIPTAGQPAAMPSTSTTDLAGKRAFRGTPRPTCWHQAGSDSGREGAGVSDSKRRGRISSRELMRSPSKVGEVRRLIQILELQHKKGY